MYALTIRQPWAQLIAAGIKQWENRTWKTSYRGPLAIHAAKAGSHRPRQSESQAQSPGKASEGRASMAHSDEYFPLRLRSRLGLQRSVTTSDTDTTSAVDPPSATNPDDLDSIYNDPLLDSILPDRTTLVFGAIIAVVDMVDILPVGQVGVNIFATGPNCWLLERPRLIDPPIYIPGKRRLWTLPADIQLSVQKALE